MRFSISKEDGDRLLEQYLVEITNKNGTKRCAEESYNILENPFDCELLIALIFRGSLENNNMIPPHITEFEAGVLSALTSLFCCCDVTDIPKPLQPFFEDAKNDDEIFERVRSSNKLKFAVSNFVQSYYHYDYFESKYPEISKML